MDFQYATGIGAARIPVNPTFGDAALGVGDSSATEAPAASESCVHLTTTLRSDLKDHLSFNASRGMFRLHSVNTG